ncbi:MAG TPA: serine protease, partial [Bryobacteraceae bacterium]
MREIFGEVVEQLRRITVQVRTVYGNANRIGSGSGVVWSPEGQIVTNSHVIEGAMRSGVVEVEFWDGRRAEGKIASRDQ